MYKVCNRCGKEKLLEDFPIKKLSKTGKPYRYFICKACKYTRQKTKAVERREWIDLFKKSISCIKCGESEAVCLDFHHVDPASKDRTISDMVKSNSIPTIIKEIEKCVVLCANCHRKVHAGVLEL